jgi:putative phosphoesterase
MCDVEIIGLISDTHGLMRQEALTALKGSDLIIHAGDVGKPGIIEQLRAVAPLVAVKGNIDKGVGRPSCRSPQSPRLDRVW